MLEELHRIMREDLLGLIEDPNTPWQTLDVLYEEPRVERVWVQLGENRLNLHRIHPCEQAFFHPHPWPSAVHILTVTEGYRMRIGFGNPADHYSWSTVVGTLNFGAGSSYEMLDSFGFHDVMPIGGPSLSVMLSGKPWSYIGGRRATELPKPKFLGFNRPLTEEAKNNLLADIKQALTLGGF